MTAAFACRCGYHKPAQHLHPHECIDYLRGRVEADRANLRDLDARVRRLEEGRT